MVKRYKIIHIHVKYIVFVYMIYKLLPEIGFLQERNMFINDLHLNHFCSKIVFLFLDTAHIALNVINRY